MFYFTSFKYIFSAFFTLITVGKIFPQYIVINEISSANHTIIQDEDGDYEDWIELYNAGDEPVDLTGWGLTDKPDEPYRWVFPEKIILPGEYLIVWASGKDRRPSPNELKAGIQRQVYNNIPGNSVADLLNSSDFPDNPTSVNLVTDYFEAPTNIADNYGQRMHGLLLAPLTGNYTFWIASDDNSHLLLSTDENPGNAVKIAEVPDWTNPREWHKFPQQQSQQIYLQEGNLYYISALMKEGIGGDNLAVRWRLPNNSMEEPLPASRIFWQNPELHTNFKIKSSGEPVILSDNMGNIIDQTEAVAIPSDISYGRFPDAGEQWVYFDMPTPGSQNLDHIFPGYTEKPVLSLNGGFYDHSINVSMYSATPESTIYYSLDGSEPNESSYLYTQPVTINQTTVLRARTFNHELHPGDISTATYLINEDITMAVVSVTTDPPNLYDDEYGIFVLTHPHQQSNLFQKGMDWERPSYFELFEPDGTTAISMDVGLRVHGGLTRIYPLKSLAIMARSRYGNDRMNHRVFPDKNIDSYKNLVLRNSGNDVHNSLFRDSFQQYLLVGQMDLELSGYRPSVIFLNGEYWGIRNIREKLNEHFLASNANADPDKVDMLEFTASNTIIGEINGSSADYLNLTDYIALNDLSITEHYEYVKGHIDISNFIQYNVAEIYFDNTDWPGNNKKWWRTNDPPGKWRWMMFDVDFGFGLMYEFGQESGSEFYQNNTLAMALEANGPIWPNPPHSTFLLRNLMKNEQFRTKFINTFCDHLNTTFQPGRVNQILMDFKAIYEPEIERLVNTFPMDYHLIDHESDWYNSISIMSEFASNRPQHVFLHLMGQFNLQQRRLLTVDVSDKQMGRIKINSIICDQYPWSGHYFPGLPIKVTALPNHGYRFTHWSDGSTEREREIFMTSATSLTAIFEISDFDPYSIIINEIKYISSENMDTHDWVELYNTSSHWANLSRWSIRGNNSNSAFVFDENTWIEPGGFMIICRDSIKFRSVHPHAEPLKGNMPFELSSNGGTVSLYDHNNNLINMVMYSSSGLWPDLTTSPGSSIELINPLQDNLAAQNWKPSIPEGGTPGEPNSVWESLRVDSSVPNVAILHPAFPNPFHAATNVRLTISAATEISITIFNANGQMVRHLTSGKHLPGEYHYSWDATNQQGQKMPAGLYLIRVMANGQYLYRKLIYKM